MVQEAHLQHARPSRRRVRHAGFLMGVGAGALLQSILLRQLLGWHPLVESSSLTVWEGLYHLGALLALLSGIVLLYWARTRLSEPASGRVLIGSALVGTGLFSLAEGVLAHYVLGLHHVRPVADNVAAWDAAHLGAGLLIVAAGWRMLVVAARLRATGSRSREAKRIGRRAS